MVVKDDANTVGGLRGSINWVLLFWGRFFIAKSLSQIQKSTFLQIQDANLTPSIDGFGIRRNQITTVLVVVLGVASAFLSLPKEAEGGALNLQLWKVVGVLIGVSALSVFFFVLHVQLS